METRVENQHDSTREEEVIEVLLMGNRWKRLVIVPSLSQRDLQYQFVFTAFTLGSACRRALSLAAAET